MQAIQGPGRVKGSGRIGFEGLGLRVSGSGFIGCWDASWPYKAGFFRDPHFGGLRVRDQLTLTVNA